MARNFQDFSVYEGLLDSSKTQALYPVQTSDSSCSDGSHENFPANGKRWRDELGLALVAAEERLSVLLQDRKRMGRALSCDVLQVLYSIGRFLQANPAPCVQNDSQPSLYKYLLAKQLDRVAQSLRRNIQQIESGVIARVSLPSEIRKLISACTSNGCLSIQLDIKQEALTYLTQEEEEELLTVTREALNNCVRHAQASKVTISLKATGNLITLAIGDDGKGFLLSPPPASGFGLMTMAAKTEKIGWHFAIDSRMGRGTVVKAEHIMSPLPPTFEHADTKTY